MIINCLGMSTISFSNLGIYLSIYFALTSFKNNMEFNFSKLHHRSIYILHLQHCIQHLLLILPHSSIISTHSTLKSRKSKLGFTSKNFDIFQSLFGTLLFFGIFLGTFLYASFTLGNSWNFLQQSFLFPLWVSDLTPNLGLFWYFFTEVFKQYK